jgi:thiosulfate reductase cytochrome b subunit
MKRERERVPYSVASLVLIAPGLLLLPFLTIGSWGHGGWVSVGLVVMWLLVPVIIWDIKRCGVDL